MKRYLMIDTEYDGGVIGSVDSLDDIPFTDLEAIDTTTGIMYENYGDGWKPSGDVPEVVQTREESEDIKPEELIKNIYYVDPREGSDNNDGLDISRPLQALSAALRLSKASPGRSRIYFKGYR